MANQYNNKIVLAGGDVLLDLTSDTVTAATMLAGTVAHDKSGAAITGTMTNRGAVSKTLDATTNNQSYTVPQGYHSGSGKVQIVLETKTTTPTKSTQNITPTSGKVLSNVTVNPIPATYQDVSNVDATDTDVLEGKTFVDSSGNEVVGEIPINDYFTDTVLSPLQTYLMVYSGYYPDDFTVSIDLEQKTATPTTSSQDIWPTVGKVLSKVTVNPIPSQYGDTTGDTGTAADVLSGVKVHSISSDSAVQLTGTMPNNGAVSATIDGTTETSYTIPEGYHNGAGTVTLTDEIWGGAGLIDEATATLYNRYFTSAGEWRTDSGSRSFFIDCTANKRYIVTATNPGLTIFRVASIPYSTSDTLPSRVPAGKIVRMTSCGAVAFTTDANAKGLVIQVNAGIADARTVGLSVFG